MTRVDDVLRGILCLALSLSLWVWSGIWAYRDGKKRGKPGVSVAAFVMLFWPIGLLAWVVFRPERKPWL
jgi:hypothetical protein